MAKAKAKKAAPKAAPKTEPKEENVVVREEVIEDPKPKATAPSKKTESFRGTHESTVDSFVEKFISENNITDYEIVEIVYPDPAGDGYWTKTIEYK